MFVKTSSFFVLAVAMVSQCTLLNAAFAQFPSPHNPLVAVHPLTNTVSTDAIEPVSVSVWDDGHDVKLVSLFIGSTLVSYNVATDFITLINVGSCRPSSSGVLENQSFRVHCQPARGITAAGGVASFPISFKSSLANTTQILNAQASDTSGMGGAPQAGSWTITASLPTPTPTPGAGPTIGILTPAAVSSLPLDWRNLESTYLHSQEPSQLSYGDLAIDEGTFDGVEAAWVRYGPDTDTFFMRSDDDQSWPYSCTAGSNTVLENRHGLLDCRNSRGEIASGTLRVTWRLALKSLWAGKTLGVHLHAKDRANVQTRWSQLGLWSVSAPPAAPPTSTPTPTHTATPTRTATPTSTPTRTATATPLPPHTATPAPTSAAAGPSVGTLAPAAISGATLEWTDIESTYLHTGGAPELLYGDLLVEDGAPDGTEAVWLRYGADTDTFFLRSDDNQSWPQSCRAGANTIIENRHGRFDCKASSRTLAGQTLRVRWRVALKSIWGGAGLLGYTSTRRIGRDFRHLGLSLAHGQYRRGRRTATPAGLMPCSVRVSGRRRFSMDPAPSIRRGEL